MASIGGYGEEGMLSGMIKNNYNAKTCKRKVLKNDCELSPIDNSIDPLKTIYKHNR